MRDSNYLRVFPLQTPYFTVLANGTGVNTTPLFASWLNGLGMNEDTGVVFIEQDHPDNGFAVKTGVNSAALVLVPMPYISRLQASSGVLLIAGPLTGAFTVPTPAANQHIFVFKNGQLQASVPATIPAASTATWAILLTNDNVA
jgi:hypothetical protein